MNPRESRGESLFARQRRAGINDDDVRLASYFAGFGIFTTRDQLNISRDDGATKLANLEDAAERAESYEGRDI